MNAAIQTIFSPIPRHRLSVSTSPGPRTNYRPDIDGLRALAIIPVVVFHAFPLIMPGGFVGVDIFFVISGFLISNILLHALHDGTFSFGHFYSNRIKRIFPALLVVLTSCLVFGWFFLLPDEYTHLGKHIAGAVGYVENFVLRREAGYFDVSSALKPLMHLWSLGIEEQFYITYPLILWIFWRLRLNLFGIVALLGLASFSLNAWQVHHDVVGAFFLPQTRCWELLIGGSIACWQLQDGPRIRGENPQWTTPPGRNRPSVQAFHNVSSFAGLILILAAIFLIHEGDSFPGWRALLPAGGAALLIVGGPKSWINRKILATRMMVSIGLISYSLYLWHWPILAFPRILHGGEPGFLARIAEVLISFVLAWATWRYIENPIRFGPNTRFKIAALVTISILIGMAGYVTHAKEGFVSRFPTLADDLDRSPSEAFATQECHKTIGDDIAYCRSNAPGPPDVLLIGDSHAGALYRGLAAEYQKRAQVLMNLGMPGCVPFYDTESYTGGAPQDPPCVPAINHILDFATSSSSAHTIILALRGPSNLVGHDFGAYSTGPLKEIRWREDTQASQEATFQTSFASTISRLQSSGKTIVLFIDWPELDFDPRSCLPRPVSFFAQPRALCGVPRNQVDARNREYREAIEHLREKFAGVRTFDPLPYLCNQEACYAMKDGHLLYRDDNHLSAVGSAYVAQNFLKEEDVSHGHSAPN